MSDKVDVYLMTMRWTDKHNQHCIVHVHILAGSSCGWIREAPTVHPRFLAPRLEQRRKAPR